MSTALVLAAGMGQRLRTVHDGPKWMIRVKDTTPMDEQLAAIVDSGIFDRLLVVVNRDDAIASRLASLRPDIEVELIVNENAERWNNWSSALLGLTAAGDDAVMLFNSDLFADRGWFREALVQIVESTEPALLIDLERHLTDEAMKVAGGSHVTRIGKVGVDQPAGEYVGIAWWPPTTAKSILHILNGYRVDPASADRWYEHAIDSDIDAGQAYRITPTPSLDWVEIDDPDDLHLAVDLRR